MNKFIGAVLVLVLLSGCDALPYQRQMEEMAMVRTLGLDGMGAELTVTAATAGGQNTPALVLSARGQSLVQAAQSIQGQGDTFIYYGYVDQLLLGADTALAGVEPVLDYLVRQEELGLSVQMWVVRGGTAGQAIRGAGDQGVTDRLSQLKTDSRVGAAASVRTAVQVMSALADSGAAWLPVLELSQSGEGEGADAVLTSESYAVLSDGRLAFFVEGDAARGLELLEEKGVGQISSFEVENGVVAGLERTEVSTSCRPAIEDGKLTGLEIICRVTARLVQAEGRLSEEEQLRLEHKLAQQEVRRLAAVLELAQVRGLDFLGLKDAALAPRPWQKSLVEEQWQSAFPALKIKVRVESTVEQGG